jgi:hypothetical protein
MPHAPTQHPSGRRIGDPCRLAALCGVPAYFTQASWCTPPEAKGIWLTHVATPHWQWTMPKRAWN